ncbi:MAG: hypothetical protein RMY63_19650 [Nostoc sp. ChiQUE01b]|nr:hypothetical protein [Nostoc sp. ChiQUE01b]MDZ8260594.1 hypothetical protein [Nostoc sp. ChiQUE01b]
MFQFFPLGVTVLDVFVVLDDLVVIKILLIFVRVLGMTTAQVGDIGSFMNLGQAVSILCQIAAMVYPYIVPTPLQVFVEGICPPFAPPFNVFAPVFPFCRVVPRAILFAKTLTINIAHRQENMDMRVMGSLAVEMVRHICHHALPDKLALHILTGSGDFLIMAEAGRETQNHFPC